MKPIYYVASFMLTVTASGAQAEDINGFDPAKSCVEVLSNTGGTTDQFMIASWVFGYLAAQNGTLRPVTIDNNKVVLKNLTKACIDSGGAPLLDLVKKSRSEAGDNGGSNKGSEEDARAVLSKFLNSDSDLKGLTQAVLPSAEGVRAVYDEPLAGRIMAMYDAALTPDVRIGPKPGQSELLVVYTTTGALKSGAPVLDEFPGGYKKVAPYFKADVPIVRFKFVEPGKTLGMAYDGLVFVNDSWMWMPKPWRALEN